MIKQMATLKSMKITSATVTAKYKLDEDELEHLIDQQKVKELEQVLTLRVLPPTPQELELQRLEQRADEEADQRAEFAMADRQH